MQSYILYSCYTHYMHTSILFFTITMYSIHILTLYCTILYSHIYVYTCSRKQREQLQDAKDHITLLTNRLEQANDEYKHKTELLYKRDELITTINNTLSTEIGVRKGLENYRDVLLKQLNEKEVQLQRIGQSNALLQTLACDRLQEIGGLKVSMCTVYMRIYV